jgi:IS5 family transposase
MYTLINFGVDELYRHVSKLGDRLAHVKELVDWEKYRPILAGLYKNRTEKEGRPNLDELAMLRALILQNWYGLSDPELEFQLADRISFQHFIGISFQIPDFTTLWRFRERLN